MEDDIAKFLGEWVSEDGYLLLIQKGINRSITVSLSKGTPLAPILRPFYENRPTTSMPAHLDEYERTLVVQLWKKNREFTMHLTYEWKYQLDPEQRNALVPGISWWQDDDFLQQYYHIFGDLKHYVRKDAEQGA